MPGADQQRSNGGVMTALYFLLGLLGLVLVIGLYVMVTYNGLVSLKNMVSEAWSGIEVQMKRRYNLVPNLVETVKGYVKHERGTLEAVTQARGAAMANQGSPAEQAKSENLLAGTLKTLFALSENYPDLKAHAHELSAKRMILTHMSPDMLAQADAVAEEAPADKYAVAADGRDLSTSISHEVGRAPYFIILSETGELVEVIQNPYLELKYGLGPIVADMLAEKEVTVLIGGFAGPNMHSKLKSSGIRFTHGKGGVKQVVNSLRPEVH